MTSPRAGSVGIVGTGNMGGGMAANLLARGWTVHVHDIDAACQDRMAALGAHAHACPRAVAEQVPVVIVCVVDAKQVHEVLFGADGVAVAGGPRTVVLTPTIGPDDVEEVVAALAEQGLDCIDAPMSGGPARARDGSMSLMVACADPLFARHEGLLRALASRLFRVGTRPGDGARTKLVNNLLAGINLVGAAEVMVLAQRMGLDLHRTLQVINESSGHSWIGADRMARAIEGDFEPRAHMTLLAKDTRLALDAGQVAGEPGPLGERACAVFAQALQAGLANEDDGALFKHLGGVVPRMKP